MQKKPNFFLDRKLTIDYWHSEPRLVSSAVLDLENKLSFLGSCQIRPVETIEALGLYGADLFVLTCPVVLEDQFTSWFRGIEKRLLTGEKIKIPTLIFSDVPFQHLLQIFEGTILSNWYCDIVHSQHTESLPMRVANLIRIHDHLKEMEVYEKQIGKLELGLKEMQNKLKNLNR